MGRLLPEEAESPGRVDDLSTKRKVRGVTIGRIEPQAVEPGPPFDTYRYRLEIIGHYDQLGEFLSDIASLPRIIVPQDVILKAAAGQAQKLLGDTLGALLEAQFGIRTLVKPGNIIGRLKATTIRPREIVFTVQEFGFERQESLQLAKQEVTP